MWARVMGLAAVLWLLPTAALAQSIDLSLIQDVARAKAEEGLALFEEERWEEAYERFRLAEELYHAPTLGLHMAHCKRHLGQLIAAKRLYEAVAAEELPEEAPPAFRDALAEAATRAEELEGLIPRVSIELSGELAPKARVLVDGQAPASLVDVRLDPGMHRIDVSAPGAEAISRELDLTPGAGERVVIEVAPIEVARPPAPSPPPPPIVLVPEPGSLVPGLVSFGVSAAGLVMGAVAGGIALSRIQAIQAECDGDVCPDSLVDDADDAQLAATVSNVGFVIGAVGAVVGTVLVIVRPGGDDARTSLRVGPSSLLFEVAF